VRAAVILSTTPSSASSASTLRTVVFPLDECVLGLQHVCTVFDYNVHRHRAGHFTIDFQSRPEVVRLHIIG
jgi:hypothetical protein